jgi:hypothetical protein
MATQQTQEACSRVAAKVPESSGVLVRTLEQVGVDRNAVLLGHEHLGCVYATRTAKCTVDSRRLHAQGDGRIPGREMRTGVYSFCNPAACAVDRFTTKSAWNLSYLSTNCAQEPRCAQTVRRSRATGAC